MTGISDFPNNNNFGFVFGGLLGCEWEWGVVWFFEGIFGLYAQGGWRNWVRGEGIGIIQ